MVLIRFTPLQQGIQECPQFKGASHAHGPNKCYDEYDSVSDKTLLVTKIIKGKFIVNI